MDVEDIMDVKDIMDVAGVMDITNVTDVTDITDVEELRILRAVLSDIWPTTLDNLAFCRYRTSLNILEMHSQCLCYPCCV